VTDPDQLARIRERARKARDRYLRIGLCGKTVFWDSGWSRLLKQALGPLCGAKKISQNGVD
jgi:hypothetical protein